MFQLLKSAINMALHMSFPESSFSGGLFFFSFRFLHTICVEIPERRSSEFCQLNSSSPQKKKVVTNV